LVERHPHQGHCWWSFILIKATVGGASSSDTCTFSQLNNNFLDMVCASNDTPLSTCSAKIGAESTTHYLGYWSPDYYGAVYKGAGSLNQQREFVDYPLGRDLPGP
jgi:hypothetical protein